MHPAGQQQQRRGNSSRMPLMYPSSLPPGTLLPGPPIPLRYGGNSTYQQPLGGIGGGGGGGGMKHHQRGGGNRGGRGGSITPHRQQRPTAGSRYHPYAFRQPLPPQQQRSYRPTQFAPRTPAAYMGTPPGMSQSEYEPIHSAQVQRDKEKLVRHGNVLAPSNTTQFLIRDHNRQTTPSSIATPTPTHQTIDTSPLPTPSSLPSLPYDQMFEIGDVDAQSDDTESNQDLNLSGLNPAFDNDFNDIYYQCRYERYAAFSPSALLNEVLSLCANIDRLQHEKSEVETRLRNVQQHLYNLTTSASASQNRSTNDDGNTVSEDNSRPKTPPAGEQQNEPINEDTVNGTDNDVQASAAPESIAVEQAELVAPPVETHTSEHKGNEQSSAQD